MSTSSQHLEFDSSAEVVPSWKQEVNERLAAHRTRRTRKNDNYPRLPLSMDGAEPQPADDSASVAARVAARYSKAPTYSEMIAAEVRAAAEAAKAAVEAAQQAHAATQAIVEGLDRAKKDAAATPAQKESSHDKILVSETSAVAGASVRSSIDVETSPARNEAWTPRVVADPLEEELVIPPQPLPANLIEFPRELIAARKARPRLAEGPLREEAGLDSEKSQLRIFEVEAENISNRPDVELIKTEWSSIRLDAHPTSASDPVETAHVPARRLDLPIQTASIGDRVMAAIVDLALILTGFLAFAFVFVSCTTHPPTGKPAAAGAALVLLVFIVAYQLLFFTYSESTPGMRYAKIALCTFEDENPTRKAMRRRIAAVALSLSPIGLGAAWAFFDEDRLSWHDRITKMYQRSYR